MIKEPKHNLLREMLIEKTQRTASPEIPSISKLKKLSDEQLVKVLFENSVLGERNYWKEEILKVAMRINPEKKFSTNGTSAGLINQLVKLVEESKKFQI